MSILSDAELKQAMATGVTYKGDYQEQKGITPEEIRDIRERRGYALSEVIKNSQTMARDISALAKDIATLRETITAFTSRVNLYMGFFVSALVALVLGILAKLLVL